MSYNSCTRPGRDRGEARGDHEGREPEWALPRPSDLRRPPKAEAGGEEVTPRDTLRQDGSPTEQRYPTPRQQLLEADKIDVVEGLAAWLEIIS